jgi:hypothetical protein
MSTSRSGYKTTAGATFSLVLLKDIFHYHSSHTRFDGLWQNEGVRNFTDAYRKLIDRNGTTNATQSIDAPGGNIVNKTESWHEGFAKLSAIPMGFYLYYASWIIIMLLIAYPLFYFWDLKLEALLPTRPRRFKSVTSTGDRYKDTIDELKHEEEDVVRKWLLAGRIRRQSSLSWRNVICKWLLDVTIGLVLRNSIRILLHKLLFEKATHRRSFSMVC